MSNTRFATVIHILTILAQHTDKWLSSDWIAGSINVNPVVVRKETIVLKNAGFVASRKGKEGGIQLSKKPEDISLSAIYKLVKNSDVLGRKNRSPNPACPIGKNINAELDRLFIETDRVVDAFLATRSLKGFVEHFT